MRQIILFAFCWQRCERLLLYVFCHELSVGFRKPVSSSVSTSQNNAFLGGGLSQTFVVFNCALIDFFFYLKLLWTALITCLFLFNQVPNYYKIIKKPMDLKKVKKRLQLQSSQYYKSTQEFVSDVRLIFKNCAKYNEVSSMSLNPASNFSCCLCLLTKVRPTKQLMLPPAQPRVIFEPKWSERICSQIIDRLLKVY